MHSHYSGNQRFIRTVSPIGLCKGTGQPDIRPDCPLLQDFPGHTPQTHGSGRMRAGRANHDRAYNIKYVHIIFLFFEKFAIVQTAYASLYVCPFTN